MTNYVIYDKKTCTYLSAIYFDFNLSQWDKGNKAAMEFATLQEAVVMKDIALRMGDIGLGNHPHKSANVVIHAIEMTETEIDPSALHAK